MLYSRYSSPMDLVGRYINQGRFGTFIQEFIKEERARKDAQEEKENDMMLWLAYIHSGSEKPFPDWKRDLAKSVPTKDRRNTDHDLTDEGIDSIIGKLFPSQTGPGK